MSGTVELFLDQGTTFNPTISLIDDNGTPYNLSNVNVKSQMRRSYYSANATAEFIVSTGNDPTLGTISLFLDSSNTATLFPTRYVFDVILTYPDLIKNKVLEGLSYVNPGATKF